VRWVLIPLAIIGIIVSSLALREHYRTDRSPCSINERWDCGIVNHSPFAMLGGVVGLIFGEPTPHPSLIGAIPVAAIGIAGYLLLGILAWRRWYLLTLIFTLGALGFALYLAWIEKNVLGVWCIYCVISLGVISLMSVLTVATVLGNFMARPSRT
jgi:uncharacterized membrane protein